MVPIKLAARSLVSVVVAALMVVTALAPAPALAQDKQAERPWAKGVSSDNQRQALQLFREGNGLLKESVFVQAAHKYREALKHWDHPAIHYNLVLALLNMDQPVEVHQHLEKALRYGPEPLDAEKFAQAQAYLALIEKQLAKVSIRCEEPEAKVVMDGRPLFTAPGRWEGWVRSGPHTVVATKEGFLTNQLSRNLPPGEVTDFELKLFTADSLTEYRRKWSVWIPWAVLGAGVVVGGAGGAMHYTARESFKEFDAGIDACGGCVPPSDVEGKRSTGNTLQAAAIGSYAVGGAAVVAGAVLVYINRLQPYQVTPTLEQKDSATELSIAPLFGNGVSGASATIRF